MATAAPELEETTPHQPATAVDAAAASPRATPIEPVSQSRAASSGNPAAEIDYELFLDCVHCGLCTASCPTYVETGNENDSPRGRIYLMRAVTDGRLELTHEVRRHLELCLDCRACETACPSGVQYGKLIEPFRVGMEATAAMRRRKATTGFIAGFCSACFPIPSGCGSRSRPARIAQTLRPRSLADSDWALCDCCRRDCGRLVDDAAAAARSRCRHCPNFCRP